MATRLWRGQTGLLLPLINYARIALCAHLTRLYGNDWPVRWQVPDSREVEVHCRDILPMLRSISPIHVRKTLRCFSEEIYQLGRVEHLTRISVAQQDLARLPEVRHRGGDGRTAILVVCDLRVRKVRRHVAPPRDHRQQVIAQGVGARLKALRRQHGRQHYRCAGDDPVQQVVDRRMQCLAPGRRRFQQGRVKVGMPLRVDWSLSHMIAPTWASSYCGYTRYPIGSGFRSPGASRVLS